MVKANKLREKSAEELEREVSQTRDKLFQMKFENISGKLKNQIKVRGLRKDIARMLTIINEKKMEKK